LKHGIFFVRARAINEKDFLARLGEQRDLALLFKNLATLRTDAPLFNKFETLRWRGATPAFAAWADRMEAPRLLERCEKAAGR